MRWLRLIFFRLQPFFNRKKIEEDLSEEIRSHLALQTEANMAAGMTVEDARYAAQREFGGIAQTQERWRDERTFRSLEIFGRDLRFALRSLTRARGFTVTVLLTIAVCLGANVTIFAFVSQVLLRPLPFPEADRLVTIYDSYPKGGVLHGGVSPLHYFERTAQITAFSETAAWFGWSGTLGGDRGPPEPVELMAVTPSFFRLLGIQAQLGRTFVELEGVEGKDSVVMLSDEFWRSHYNASSNVLRQSVRIDREPYTVVGVLPPGFHYLSRSAKVWSVCSFSEFNRQPDQRYRTGMEMIARLRPDTTVAVAQAEVDALNARPVPGDYLAPLVAKMGYHTIVRDLKGDHVAPWRRALLLLQAGVFFLLLIGAVNLGNLLLVRATGRAREFAVRQALGASRLQLFSALIMETLVLAIIGGALGLGLGAIALRGIAFTATDRMPPDLVSVLDQRTCIGAGAFTLIFGLLLAIPAAWQTLRGNLNHGLSLESRGGTTARAVHRFRHSLIVAQIALAFVLLWGCALLGYSFVRVLAVEPGFRQENVLTGTVTLPWAKYGEPAQRDAFAARLLAELRTMPGVISVGTSTRVPLAGVNLDDFTPVEIEGRSLAADESPEEEYYRGVTGDYFAAMGVPLKAGRLLTADDVKAPGKRCVIDTTLARRYWPRGDALGHRLTFGGGHPKKEDFSTIVGIVGAVKQNSLADLHDYGVVYYPTSTFSQPAFTVVIRTTQAPEAVGATARAAVLRLDPELPLTDVKSMSSRVDESLTGRRFPLLLANIFASIALVLAAIGIYGVLAHSVAQRRREIGVRLALGANPRQIRWQFLRLAGRLFSLGLCFGLLGAGLTGRLMESLVFGVGPANPVIFGCTALILAAVVLVACLVPARRAANVDPIVVLKCE